MNFLCDSFKAPLRAILFTNTESSRAALSSERTSAPGPTPELGSGPALAPEAATKDPKDDFPDLPNLPDLPDLSELDNTLDEGSGTSF